MFCMCYVYCIVIIIVYCELRSHLLVVKSCHCVVWGGIAKVREIECPLVTACIVIM